MADSNQHAQVPSRQGSKNPTIQSQTTREASSNSTRPINNRGIPTSTRRQKPAQIRQRPHYSLAGAQSSFSPWQMQGPTSFVDPNYYALNPSYQKPQNSPVWGLAKTLPRVVRPGMRAGSHGRKDRVVEDEDAEREQPGSTEAVPQVGMIDEQREHAGKDATREPGERIGYGEQKRQPSQRSMVESFGTPLVERGNPMDEDFLQRPKPTSVRSERDLGDQNAFRKQQVLTDVPEVTSTDDFAAPKNEDRKVDGIDLEAGRRFGEEKEDWTQNDWEGDEDWDQNAMEERNKHNMWASIRSRFREPLAECLATMIAVLIGLTTNLAVKTSSSTYGDYQSTNWAWGLGVTIGIYIAGGISGGHLNPAISLTLFLYRGFPIRKAGIYILAQILGSFLAGLLAYAIYRDAITSFNTENGKDLFTGGTGSSFYTQPSSFINPGTAFLNEFTATAILSCTILALGDDSNAPPGAGIHALIVGLIVMVLTMAFGYNTGACLNPARDFGPRIATAIVGYGWKNVFLTADAWWVYGAWGATILGALVGGLAYDGAVFVGGESPVNYPRGKRKRKEREAKERAWRRWLGFRRGVERVELGVRGRGELGKDG